MIKVTNRVNEGVERGGRKMPELLWRESGRSWCLESVRRGTGGVESDLPALASVTGLWQWGRNRNRSTLGKLELGGKMINSDRTCVQSPTRD
jgi:hypothetical protein